MYFVQDDAIISTALNLTKIVLIINTNNPYTTCNLYEEIKQFKYENSMV